MRKFMANAKAILWEFVELGFVTILAIMLIYLILGQGSGVFVTSVAENVTKFASGVPRTVRRQTYPLTSAQLILWLASDNSLHLVVKTR